MGVSIPMRWIQVTKFRINIERSASSSNVAKVVEETDVVNEYHKSAMGRRNLCIQKKEKLNDFGQFKKAVSKELMKLRAEQKKIEVKELYKQKSVRKNTHPVLRSVVGKFRKKLMARVEKKQIARKNRLRKQKIRFT